MQKSKYVVEAYKTMNETNIEYEVEGKIYRKTIPSQFTKGIRIYYKIKNPNNFKTVTELKIKRESYATVNPVAIFMQIMCSIVLIIFGILMIKTFAQQIYSKL